MASPINVSYVTPGAVIVVAAVFPVLGIVAVGLRIYVRRLQKARLLADDWLLVPALGLIAGMGIALIIGAQGGGIGYTKGLPPGAPPEAEFTYLAPNVILAEKVEFIFQLLQILSLGCVKLSFIMFYRRIFCTGQRTWFSVSTAIMGVLIVSWTVAFFFVFVFYCGSRPWEEWSTVVNIIKYCPHGQNDQMALGVSDSIMDVIIIGLPIPAILGLHLGIAKKMMLIGVFLLGGFAVAASMVRMGIFIKVVLVGYSPNLDGDKDISLILFWSIIESGTAILAACLPTLTAVVSQSTIDRFLRSLRSTLSLQSHSSRPWLSWTSNPKSRRSEGSSVDHINNVDGVSSVESYAMKDNDGHDATGPQGREIRLQNTFQQQESYV